MTKTFEECKWCNGSGDDGGGYGQCPDCESTGFKGGRAALEAFDEWLEQQHSALPSTEQNQ